jgi:hypothetical protein
LPDGEFPVLRVNAIDLEAAIRQEAEADMLRKGWENADAALTQELTDLLVAALVSEPVGSQV